MTTTVDSRKLLTGSGELAEFIAGFTPREAQISMATKIEEVTDQNGKVVIEAGTGTGKTFAYLLPILLSSKKAIISTGTKNLQDQLYHRDLPTLQKALNVDLSSALLKGRANYLCRYRMEVNQTDGRFQSREVLHDLQLVIRWAMETKTGDIAELTDVAEDAQVWPYVTSSVDNCLGQDCPSYENCCVIDARKQAMEADLVVVNHHLFFADASLKGEGVGELLPGVDVVVFDEAHQLHDTASSFFGRRLSSRQLMELSKDSWLETLQAADDMTGLITAAKQLEKDVLDFRLAFGDEPRRGAWFELENDEAIAKSINDVKATLGDLVAQLKIAGPRSKGLAACFERAEETLALFCQLTANGNDQYIHWFETFTKACAIYLTPLSVAEEFGDYISAESCSWVFTSATLTIGSDFSHFSKALGLTECDSLQLPSPFDYPNQAVFYVPRMLPDPSDSGFTRASVEAAIPVIKASKGRAFFLFTSHRALREAADLLADALDYPLFIQGSVAKNELLSQFCESKDGVLLGTSSFWEGVDVRGDALSLVIIDKLPFSSPGDPVEKARIDHYKKSGANAFFDYQMPAAAIALKQGAGRLIRDETDKGVLMICDPRIVSKNYGATFVRSLPSMSRTRDLDKVTEFLSHL